MKEEREEKSHRKEWQVGEFVMYRSMYRGVGCRTLPYKPRQSPVNVPSSTLSKKWFVQCVVARSADKECR